MACLTRWPRSAAADDWWDGLREGPVTSLRRDEPVRLPVAPVQSVTSVELLDEAGAATPFAGFYFDAADGFGRLALKSGQGWPTPLRAAGGIRIRFVAGYGADG